MFAKSIKKPFWEPKIPAKIDAKSGRFFNMFAKGRLRENIFLRNIVSGDVCFKPRWAKIKKNTEQSDKNRINNRNKNRCSKKSCNKSWKNTKNGGVQKGGENQSEKIYKKGGPENRCETQKLRKKPEIFRGGPTGTKRPHFSRVSCGGYLQKSTYKYSNERGRVNAEVGCVIGGEHARAEAQHARVPWPGADPKLPTATYPPRA